MKSKTITILVGLVLIALAFYGGMKYSQSQVAAAGAARFANFGQGQNRQMGLRVGGGASGEILSKDANGLTVKLRDGGSKIILFVSSTTVSKMTDTSISDLKVGTQVVVSGTANTDGSINAISIQEVPNRTVK